MLNAFALTDDDPHRFDELISQVNELIKYYRLYVVPKGGKKDEEGGSQPNPGGDTPGGNSGGGNSGGDDDESDL